MNKKLSLLFFALILFLGMNNLNAQINKFKFDDIDSLENIEHKPIFIFIHTNWCKYCLAMKQSTFKNPEIINQINSKFYFIELNAEEKSNINFNKKEYFFKHSGVNSGIHELAEKLAIIENEISYPTICIIDEKYNIVFRQAGFISTKEMNYLLLNKLN